MNEISKSRNDNIIRICLRFINLAATRKKAQGRAIPLFVLAKTCVPGHICPGQDTYVLATTYIYIGKDIYILATALRLGQNICVLAKTYFEENRVFFA